MKNPGRFTIAALIIVTIIGIIVSHDQFRNTSVNSSMRVLDDATEVPTPTPTIPPTDAPEPPYPGDLDFPTVEIPVNPTWQAASHAEIGDLVISMLQRPNIVTNFGSEGPFTVLAIADVFPSDADSVGIPASTIEQFSVPDIALVIEGNFIRSSNDSFKNILTPSSISTPGPSPTPYIYRYTRVVFDRNSGAYSFFLTDSEIEALARMP